MKQPANAPVRRRIRAATWLELAALLTAALLCGMVADAFCDDPLLAHQNQPNPVHFEEIE